MQERARLGKEMISTPQAGVFFSGFSFFYAMST